MIPSKTCAFLTLENPDGFFIYDELTIPPLSKLGWSVESIPWTRDGVDWDRFDAVVIRSPWDYQNDPARFLRVLGEIDKSSARLENPLDIVRWNLDKNYLRELEARGVPIVPTRWLHELDLSQLSAFCQIHGASEAIVKPTVGANADDTFRIPADASSELASEAMDCFRDRPAMLQPFLPDVVATGEYSLFYFSGNYSHCVLKTPKGGDFRVQEEHGGAIAPVEPAEDLLRAGRRVIDAMERSLLYARVDLVRLPDSRPVLMELELIEPSLYFNYDHEAPSRFARALDALTSNGVGEPHVNPQTS